MNGKFQDCGISRVEMKLKCFPSRTKISMMEFIGKETEFLGDSFSLCFVGINGVEDHFRRGHAAVTADFYINLSLHPLNNKSE